MTDLHDPYNVVDHSERIFRDYSGRARFERELVSASQCAEVLGPRIMSGMTLLDAGCGMGHLFHSFRTRNIPVEYHGIDLSRKMIEEGQRILPTYGLPAERLQQQNIQYLTDRYDAVVCLNTLEHLPHYHIYLEKLLLAAKKWLYLRASLDEMTILQYLFDRPLDPDVNLKLYFNTYNLKEVIQFIESYGFRVHRFRDAWNDDQMEYDDVGYTYYRKVLLCERVSDVPVIAY